MFFGLVMGGWLGFRTGFRMEFLILESKGFEYLNRKEVFLFWNQHRYREVGKISLFVYRWGMLVGVFCNRL